MRKLSDAQKAQATEYEEKFVPPCCHKALITTSNKIHTYHQLKGTPFTEMTTLRSFWIKKPQNKQVSQAPVAPKARSRDNSPPPDHARLVETQKASKVEDYISTYSSDFRGRRADMRQSFKAHGNFNVNQGLVVASNGHWQESPAPDAATPPQVQKLTPFESITSYRSDYVVHPVQPRFRRNKPRRQTKQMPPAVSMLAWDRNQDLFEEASRFLQQFKSWSLKTKIYTEAEASSPPAGRKELTGKTNPTVCAPNCTATKPQSPAEDGALSGFQPVSMTTEESMTYWAGCSSPDACCLAEAKAS